MNNSKFFILIGPSGCGKGTILNMLKKNHPEFIYPISYTSRNKRKGEKDGETYHFISLDEFRRKIQNEDFLEYQLIHNSYYYGSDKKSIIEGLKTNHVIREIDYQGYLDIEKELDKKNLVSIFITTDSWDELERRIKGRQEISEEELKNRKRSFEIESKFGKSCDHYIVNKKGEIKKTYEKVRNIILKELWSR